MSPHSLQIRKVNKRIKNIIAQAQEKALIKVKKNVKI